MADFKHPDTIAGIDNKKLARDYRTTAEQIYDTVVQWDSGIMVLAVIALAPYVYDPIAAVFSFPVGYFLYRKITTNRGNLTMPVKLPVDFKGATDYHDPKPGGKKFNKANGTVPFANLRKGAQELWFAGKDLLTHMLVIGTTGAGKTETLVSLAASSAFATGSGLVYVDAKAAPKLIAQFFTLARIFGREDDLRIINYMTGNKKVSAKSWERLSNTTNPFALGSADSSVQMLTSLLPSGGGDNQVFLDRAISMVKGVMPVLVELRDRGIMNITAEKIQEFIQLQMFINLANDALYLDQKGKPVADSKLGEKIHLGKDSIKSVTSYLESTPGYVSGANAKQPEEVGKQFGFGQMYFTRALSNLSTTYGHIYEKELSEVDFADVVLNGRILIVLVPAMEQSGEERKALGKVILSSIRNAMALGLGNKAEGYREDVLESLPIDLKTPSMIIVDEYAEVATEGFAVTATQGRGLGMSVVFAGQDLSGFVRASKEEADMIFSNTRIKCLMALEDPELTWNKFNALAGDMSVVSGGDWTRNESGVDDWKTGSSISVKKVGRLSLNDLKAQTEGQAHVFERSNVHKVQMFHHGIDDKDLVTNWRINRMIMVRYPRPSRVALLQKSLEVADYFLRADKVVEDAGEEVNSLVASINKHANSGKLFWAFDLFREFNHDDEMNDGATTVIGGPQSSGMETLMALVDSGDAGDDDDNGFGGYDPLNVRQVESPIISAESGSASLESLLDRSVSSHGGEDMAGGVIDHFVSARDNSAEVSDEILGDATSAPVIILAENPSAAASQEDIIKSILGAEDNRWVFSAIQAYTPDDAKEFVNTVFEITSFVAGSPEMAGAAASDIAAQVTGVTCAAAPIPKSPSDQDKVQSVLTDIRAKFSSDDY